MNGGDQMSKEIDVLRWPAMPDPRDRSDRVWIFPRNRIRAFEQINPTNAHGSGFMIFPFSLACYDVHNHHILSVVLEQTDYRVLAQMTGERLRDLVPEGNQYTSSPMLSLYHAEAHEEIEPYEGSVDRETVMPMLLEIAAEYLDLWEEPVCKCSD
jgi:hypothetical protein